MESTCEMIAKLDSYKNGLATPPDYERQSAKFLCGVSLLNYWINHFTLLKQGK
jgi:hypothetical protein